jgi:hypothetical protein
VAGKLHQGTLELFRHDPWLAFDLLGLERPVFGTPIDRRGEVERDHPEQASVVKSNYPDLVLVHKDATGRGIVICIEAQGQLDEEKRWMLPYYQVVAAQDHKLQTWLVVISYCDRMSEALVTWKVGPPPIVDALVLDVTTVPRMVDIEQARKRPTAAVLAAALHGCRGDIDAARIGVQATMGLPARRRDSYIGTILAALSEAHKTIVIGEMNMHDKKDEIWEIERRSGTFLLGEAQGRARGLEEGRALERKLGQRRTLAELIVAVLEVRGVRLDADAEARVRSCEDLGTLERWARLAREITATAELFGAT